MEIKEAIAAVINGRNLSFDEAEAAMDTIMNGEATPAQIGSYLPALSVMLCAIGLTSAQPPGMPRIPVQVQQGGDDDATPCPNISSGRRWCSNPKGWPPANTADAPWSPSGRKSARNSSMSRPR